ncbi:hypothetical protein DL98DRAFT_604227 [Cadophora sp. DSE1049]|nr:hypothetical protein DL98DRAFT_604227 [Cadophora sp. DSE1049]
MAPSKLSRAIAPSTARLNTSTKKRSNVNAMASTRSGIPLRNRASPSKDNKETTVGIGKVSGSTSSSSSKLPEASSAIASTKHQIFSSRDPTRWFLKLPYELRAMIFSYCVEISDCQRPPLLVALRCDKELYPQCLELYYKLNYFTLSSWTLSNIVKISPRAIARIHKLCIDNRSEDRAGPLAALYYDIPRALEKATNIITLIVRSPENLSRFNDCLWVSRTIQKLPNISKVFYDGCILTESFRSLHSSRKISTDHINRGLGVQSKLTSEVMEGKKVEFAAWKTDPGIPFRWIKKSVESDT